MTPPLVSIVIPCFNAEGVVGDAVLSALTQTYQPIEVIVIDDGSTDDSLRIIKSFGERVRWMTGPNLGGAAARNRGIKLAQGDLVQFLDADDLLHAQKLQRHVPLMLARAADIVYCDWQSVEVGSTSVTRIHSSRCAGKDPVVFLLNQNMPTPTAMHWKDRLVAVGGFREGLPCSQERDLHLRLACAGSTLAHLPEVLVTVRRQAGSLSSDLTRVLDQHVEIANNARRLLKEQGRFTDERAAALAAFLVRDARQYFRHGMPDKAHAYLRQAAVFHADAGIPQTYGAAARWLLRAVGPERTEKLVSWKRRWGRQ